VELTIYSDKEKKVNKISVARDKIVVPGVLSKMHEYAGKQL
jgi:hypothetical protein